MEPLPERRLAGNPASLTDSGALVVCSRRDAVQRVRERLRERLRALPRDQAEAQDGGAVDACLSERREAERQRDSRLDRLLGEPPRFP